MCNFTSEGLNHRDELVNLFGTNLDDICFQIAKHRNTDINEEIVDLGITVLIGIIHEALTKNVTDVTDVTDITRKTNTGIRTSL